MVGRLELSIPQPPVMNACSRLCLVALTVALTSCSLPPSQAWRIVKTQGLFPYVSMELGKRPFPSGVTPLKRGIHLVPGRGTPRVTSPTSSAAWSASRPVGLGNPYLQLHTTQPAPQRIAVIPPKESSPVSPLRPAAAPPPVPAAAVAVPQRIPVSVGAPTPPAAPQREVARSQPAPKPPAATASPKPALEAVPAPKVAQAPKPKPDGIPLPKPAPPPSNNTVQPPPGSAASSAPAPAAAVPAPVEVPVATAIPGRPGFVNSPYAAKHQIVDVTGLKPGQEVKCPFSGRLFRIPADANHPPSAKP